jgi:spermidine synthase
MRQSHILAVKTPKIYLTVFLAGASVMIVEIIAARMLAPFYGSSTYVWSSIISVVLASLSLGYWLGGLRADKNPNTDELSKILFLSAFAVFLIPFLNDTVAMISYLVFGPYAGAIVSSLIILSPAGVLLGMVSPYCLKLAASDIQTIGSTGGGIYAFGTIGSIVGTLAAAFLLIPAAKTTTIIFSVSLILLLNSILFQSKKLKIDKIFLFAAIISMGLFFQFPLFAQGQILYDEITPYGWIIVTEYGGLRHLIVDRAMQGSVNLSTNHSGYEYVEYMEIPYLMKPDIKTVWVVGLGAGAGPMQIIGNHPGNTIIVSEIDPRVVEVAREYFRFRESENVRVDVGDARTYIKNTPLTFDYVILDAFNGAPSIPFYLVSREFFSDIKDKMPEDGIILLNLHSSVHGEKSKSLRHIMKTVQTQFRHTQIYLSYPSPQLYQNILLIASNQPLPGKDELARKAKDTPVLKAERIRHMTGLLYEGNIDLDGAIILTDKYNPIDTQSLP